VQPAVRTNQQRHIGGIAASVRQSYLEDLLRIPEKVVHLTHLSANKENVRAAFCELRTFRCVCSSNQVEMVMSGELWADYRRTWQEFSRKLNEMQEFADSGLNARALALLPEVKNARLEHNAARDRLAEYLAAQKTVTADREQEIRNTARLIWEFSGQPQNTAEQDWRRAEELVSAATA
jgi:hypothetical protein